MNARLNRSMSAAARSLAVGDLECFRTGIARAEVEQRLDRRLHRDIGVERVVVVEDLDVVGRRDDREVLAVDVQ